MKIFHTKRQLRKNEILKADYVIGFKTKTKNNLGNNLDNVSLSRLIGKPQYSTCVIQCNMLTDVMKNMLTDIESLHNIKITVIEKDIQSFKRRLAI